MGKPKQRYCVKAYEGKWRIWNRKMKRWWGLPYAEYPAEVLEKLNSKKKEKEAMTILQLLASLGATASMAQGRRFVLQKNVKLNGFLVTDFTVDHEFHKGDIITVGKEDFTVSEENLLNSAA